MAKRTPEQEREQFEVERELAARLKRASREERVPLYMALYDELFRRVPHHPQLSRKVSEADTRLILQGQMKILGPFLRPETCYMEIGSGDCATALAVAERVSQVVAVDVSDEITKGTAFPSNVRLVLTRGTEIPVPPGSVDIAFSADLIEHLHPEDALEQTRGIFLSLRTGGKYICVTPNRLCGPWDISRTFSRTAEGLHLKEYSIAELADLFRKAGFSRIRVQLGFRGKMALIPARWMIGCEFLVRLLPHAWRKNAAQHFPWAGYIRMVGEK